MVKETKIEISNKTKYVFRVIMILIIVALSIYLEAGGFWVIAQLLSVGFYEWTFSKISKYFNENNIDKNYYYIMFSELAVGLLLSALVGIIFSIILINIIKAVKNKNNKF